MELLIQLLQSKDIFKDVFRVLGGIYKKRSQYYCKDNYLAYTNKLSPLLLQAHIDTVRGGVGELLLSVVRQKVSANGILGADDRAGVCGIIEIAMKCADAGYELPNLLFTNYEERGGGGMRAFTRDIKMKSLSHVNLAIALDRRGSGEYVTYNHLPLPVKQYIEQWFHEEDGSFSDIEIFTDHFEIPSVNVSAGFYHEHTANECLFVDELDLTLERIMQIIECPIDKLYKSEYNLKPSPFYSYYNRRSYQSGTVSDEKFIDVCELCSDDATQYSDQSGMYLCRSCAEYMAKEEKTYGLYDNLPSQKCQLCGNLNGEYSDILKMSTCDTCYEFLMTTKGDEQYDKAITARVNRKQRDESNKVEKVAEK